VLCSQRYGVAARYGLQASVGHDCVRTDDDFVNARHHGEHSRVRDYGCRDFCLGKTYGKALAVKRGRAFSDNHLKKFEVYFNQSIYL